MKRPAVSRGDLALVVHVSPFILPPSVRPNAPPPHYRNFIVARAVAANNAATNQNRVTTCDSVQPFK